MADSFFQSVILAMASSMAGFQSHTVTRDIASGGFDLIDAPQQPGETIPDIRIRVREQDLHENESAPRIVCVPKGGDIVPSDLIGAQKNLIPGKSIQSIRTRKFRFQVYCWGEDQAEAEQLLHGSILAFHIAKIPGSPQNAFHNAINFSDEVWETQQTGEAGPLISGDLISYFATLEIMVTTQPQRLTRPAHVISEVSMGTENQEINQP